MVAAPPVVVAPALRWHEKVTAVGVLVASLAALVVVAGWHVTQGTSGIGAMDLLRFAVGSGDGRTRDVLMASRLPRMLAGLVAGVALGAAGALLSSIARNALASPDTIGVTAGATFAVTAFAAFGVSLPIWLDGLAGFVGGLVAAGVVLLAAAGSTGSTVRLILAGSALALALQAGTSALLILFQQDTVGLYAWGQGTLAQIDLRAVAQMSPLVAAVLVAAVLAARRLDLLALGDDAASVLGVRPGRTRALGAVLAVLATAASVALCGPLGFVGLCAPAVVGLLASRVPGLGRHAFRVPVSAVAGALVVLLSDIVVRAVGGANAGNEIPTGVVTTVAGAVVLVVMARRVAASGPTRKPPTARWGSLGTRRRTVVVAGVCAVALLGSLLLGLLGGYSWLLTGDLANWIAGTAVPSIDFAFDERLPRVLAAALSGAALALSGSVIQATCRNPLAEPSIIGVTAGAGLGAVVLLLLVPAVGTWSISAAAFAGALGAFGLVYVLAWRGGVDSDRLVLIGIGVSYGGTALTTMLILRSEPFNTPLVLTWLSGTTYGRTLDQLVPVAVALVVLTPLLLWLRRDIDVMSLDDDTPRVVGIRLEPVRLVVLGAAVVLAATSVSAIGVLGFVGLVAPHAARALVGGHTARFVPVAMLLGATLVTVADTVGRTLIAPSQVPAGLVVAIIGAPYFVYLLYRSR